MPDLLLTELCQGISGISRYNDKKKQPGIRINFLYRFYRVLYQYLRYRNFLYHCMIWRPTLNPSAKNGVICLYPLYFNILPNSLNIIGKLTLLPLFSFFQRYFLPHSHNSLPLFTTWFFPNMLDKPPPRAGGGGIRNFKHRCKKARKNGIPGKILKP